MKALKPPFEGGVVGYVDPTTGRRFVFSSPLRGEDALRRTLAAKGLARGMDARAKRKTWRPRIG